MQLESLTLITAHLRRSYVQNVVARLEIVEKSSGTARRNARSSEEGKEDSINYEIWFYRLWRGGAVEKCSPYVSHDWLSLSYGSTPLELNTCLFCPPHDHPWQWRLPSRPPTLENWVLFLAGALLEEFRICLWRCLLNKLIKAIMMMMTLLLLMMMMMKVIMITVKDNNRCFMTLIMVVITMFAITQTPFGCCALCLLYRFVRLLRVTNESESDARKTRQTMKPSRILL